MPLTLLKRASIKLRGNKIQPTTNRGRTMAQNFSKKENEYQYETQNVSVKNYLGYSVAAETQGLQINGLVNPQPEEQGTVSNVVPFIMISTNVANRIEDELAKFWTSKRVIRSLIREINKRNVFNFVKNMLTISDSRTVLGDIRKYITYYELKHIVYSMLKAAEELGLSDSSKYKMMYKEYNIIAGVCSKNSGKKIDKKTLKIANLRLEALFEEMSKHQY